MENENSNTSLISISEAAILLGKNIETLRRWDRNGKLRAIKIGESGHRKYRKSEVEKLLKQKRIEPVLPNMSGFGEICQFMNEKQQKIYQYLMTKDPQLPNIYAGALKVLSDKSNPDRLPQAAHSIRELTNMLFRNNENKKSTGQNVEEAKELLKQIREGGLTASGIASIEKILEDRVNETNSQKIEQVLINDGATLELAKKTAKIWKTTHDSFVAICHHGYKDVKEEELCFHLSLIENHLMSLLGEYYEAVDALDVLMAKKQPSIADLSHLKSLLKKPSQYEYFFRHLENAGWFNLLIKDNFFNFTNPPCPISDENGIRFPKWNEAQYLIKMAEIDPKSVADIVLSVKQSNNPLVYEDLLDAILKMPISILRTLVGKIEKEKWINTRYSYRVSDKISELITVLLNNNCVDDAFLLAKNMFAFERIAFEDNHFQTTDGGKTEKKYKIKTYLDEWEYQEHLKAKTLELTKIDPVKTVLTLGQILESMIKNEIGSKDYSDDGYFCITRPMVEVDENTHDDAKNALVSSIRKTLNYLAENDQQKLKTALECLSHPEGTYPVMQRLQLSMYKEYPDLFKAEIEQTFRDRKKFDDYNIAHEYCTLLKKVYPSLTVLTKDRILKWIEKGPTTKKKDFDFDCWRARKLSLIKDYLDEPIKKQSESLIGRYTDGLETEQITETTWVGPTSPMSEQEMNEKNADEVIDYLSKWDPEKGIMKPSPGGLGQIVQKIVSEKFEEYSNKTIALFNLKVRPVYLYSFVEGFKNALTSGKKLNWEVILNLCDLVTDKDKQYDFIKDEGGFYDTRWRDVEKSVIDLLKEGLKVSENQISFNDKDKVWHILSRLVENHEPNLEYEEKYGGENMNPTEMSINTVRGSAFHALIFYALWCSRNSKKRGLDQDVKTVLDNHLVNDPSLSVRSVYGQYFPYIYNIDKEWASENIPKIFEPFDNLLSQAAWKGYVGYANYWVPVVQKLRPIYEIAVKEVRKAKEKDNFANRLAEHLMIAYWRGDISLKDEILVNFFKKASESVRSHAIWFLWRSLEDAKPGKDSPEWKRLKDLWSYRVLRKNMPNESKELNHFISWLTSAPEDINSLSGLIMSVIPYVNRGVDIGYLIEYCKSNLNINMELVSELLCLLTIENPEEFRYRLYDNDISSIFDSIADTGSEIAKNNVLKAIDKFGENGNDSYRPVREKILGHNLV